jgi:hypothetical protein
VTGAGAAEASRSINKQREFLEELLANPAVQAGVAPFLTAVIVAVALSPLRLGGLAAIAAFLVCIHFVTGIQLAPLNATRKILILAIAAAAIGPLLDFALKPTRIGVALLALAAAGGALWAFGPVVAQKPGTQAWLFGGSAAVALALMVGFSQAQLAGDGVRAGAAALAVGLGAGVAAIFSGSLTYGLYGIALAAGAGGFLLPQMIRGKKAIAGATFTLPAMVTGGLVAAGAMLLAQLPWYCVLILALVPVAVRLPGPEKAPVWLQAVVFSLYGFVIAGIACALAWPSSQT